MFGYVVIDKPNILIKDYNVYRAYYCGLCKTIGKRNGQLNRLTLNYDIVLLALLGHNYENRDPVFCEGRCFVHPVGKKLSYVKRNDILDRIADINVILGYYKLTDDVIDENKHRSVRSIMRPSYKNAAKRMKRFDEAVRRGYDRLREEEKKNSDISTLADCFGYILSACGDALTDKCDKNLRKFLFYIGRWIYVIDAYDDIKKDFKDKCFNPFLREIKETDDNFYNEAERRARELLYEDIAVATDCYNAMKIEVSEGPLSNIIYRGLKDRTEFVLKRRGEKWRKETRLKY